MELIYLAIACGCIILFILGVLAPYFILRIHQSCKEEVELLKTNLEAQNQIITILWDIKHKQNI